MSSAVGQQHIACSSTSCGPQQGIRKEPDIQPSVFDPGCTSYLAIAIKYPAYHVDQPEYPVSDRICVWISGIWPDTYGQIFGLAPRPILGCRIFVQFNIRSIIDICILLTSSISKSFHLIALLKTLITPFLDVYFFYIYCFKYFFCE